jgi:Asp-tRNA(Asn)/Glu-tRNA(Gln) amidotransferase A subunit family amidase
VRSAEQLRVAIVIGALLEDCDASVLASMRMWQERIASVGAQVNAVEPDCWTSAFEIYASLQAVEAARWHTGFFDEFEPAIADRLRWGASLKDEEVAEFHARHQGFVREMDALFLQADFLLMPAVPLPRLAAGSDLSAARPRILRYTTPGSLAGLPAVVLPGKPGVQLLAARGGDSQLLEFAASLGKRLAAEEAS